MMDKVSIVKSYLSKAQKKYKNLFDKCDDLAQQLSRQQIQMKAQKSKIETLEASIELLADEVSTLKSSVLTLNEEIGTLTDKFSAFTKTAQEDKVYEIAYRNSITVIQDLNTLFELEKKIIGYQRKLKSVRNGRNAIAHFILDDDSPDLINYKLLKSIDHFGSLPFNFKTRIELDLKAPGIIDAVVGYVKHEIELLAQQRLNISDEEASDADDWFNSH